MAELAAGLRCAQITVIAEMDRLGIPRRAQRDRLAQGRRALAANRLQVRAQRETRARELGFDDLAAYLQVRLHEQRGLRKLIAAELGVTVPVVARLMRDQGVPALRGLTVAKARGRSGESHNRPSQALQSGAIIEPWTDTTLAT